MCKSFGMTSDAALVGSAEASEILGVDRSTLLRWAAAGRIKGIKLGPETAPFVFDRAEIERVAAEIERSATDGTGSEAVNQ
jgi:excisionase family DNA binding protein